MDKRKKFDMNETSNLEQENSQQYPKAKREYKDCLFRKVFEKKEDLLQLYNALNGTVYEDVGELIVNTLEDVVYLGIKNDKSFLINGTMNLYEHQSTYNPNIPVRGLIYFADLYEQYIEMNGLRLYGTKLIELPFPQYIVFYNGTKEEPERTQLKLSDAFPKSEYQPALECVATMININYGHNKELFEKCERLKEYAFFVERVRYYLSANKDLNWAVSLAVDECIEKNILRDILSKNRAEVMSMILTSFSQEEYEKTIHDEGFSEGAEFKLTEQIRKKLAKGQSAKEIAEALEEPVEIIEKKIEAITNQ